MSTATDSLAALRDQAVAGVEDLIEVLSLGATLGAEVTEAAQVRHPFRRVGAFGVAGLAADSHRLTAAHRAVADHLHRLPEQQVRLARGWTGDTGVHAVTAVVEHQRRAESDLYVLRTLAEATSAASAGIDQLLRTWYLTVARLSAPLVAGIPVAAVPEAIVTGALPLGVVIDDIASRARLYFTSADATVTGIDEILTHLNRVTETMDVEPYPDDQVVESTAQTATGSGTDEAPHHHQPPGSAENPETERPDVPLRLTPSSGSTPDVAPPPAPAAPLAPPEPPPPPQEARSAPAEDAGLAPHETSPQSATGGHARPDAPASAVPGESDPSDSSGGDLALAGDE
ncbi:hypothetical protein [Gordonia insulae]|uniref:Uncharacterized protein n=1 Tax=Gordonia insulae TaxID=2420509 RepID=A0A3G8JIP8_9ACTN|nr:hypothetical protein [Gordonia insulae]AZG44957.1 hypothetical protein D7316_01549 [Gordonia insulae]